MDWNGKQELRRNVLRLDDKYIIIKSIKWKIGLDYGIYLKYADYFLFFIFLMHSRRLKKEDSLFLVNPVDNSYIFKMRKTKNKKPKPEKCLKNV